jgi:hypothetical protein
MTSRSAEAAHRKPGAQLGVRFRRELEQASIGIARYAEHGGECRLGLEAICP